MTNTYKKFPDGKLAANFGVKIGSQFLLTSLGKRIFIALVTLITLASMFLMDLGIAEAKMGTPADKFVRTANYYLRAGTDITSAQYPSLAKYDLLVLPAEAQIYNRSMFARLRELNPHIVILAYVPSKSWNYAWTDPLHQKLFSGIQNDWWLLDAQGNRVSIWQNTSVISGVSPWSAYLPDFVRDQIWSTGLWDGVFYDEFSSNISWVNGGNIDIHRDGIKDDLRLADVAWQRGMINLLKRTRDQLGADAVIVTNGDSTGELQPYVNGRMFESFPTPWEAGGTWSGVMTNYLRLHRQVGSAPVFIINGGTGNTGNDTDYKRMRYGLTSTLMGDGFFAFDYGDQDHGQLWHYDEYDVRLGSPTSKATAVFSHPAGDNLTADVWRRDFQNGVVLVNSSGSPKTVELNSELEKIRGTQAPEVNDGSRITSVVLSPDDGVILLKPVEKITGAAFPNGAFARIFDKDGSKVRNGFFAYDSDFDGQSTILIKDLDGNGSAEKVVAGKKTVVIYGADGVVKKSFAPYGESYNLGMNIAVGDLDGDGKAEIVVGSAPGGGPQVRIFSSDGVQEGPGFFAYDSRFKGGVQVAVGDLYGTGKSIIVTGAGVGGGPQVRIFNKNGRALNGGWFAYDYRFRGGVRVAVGDLDGDGKAEIVTGAGPGGGPHVRVWTGTGRSLGKGFFASDPASRGGVQVAVTDMDGDGKAEIAALTTDVFQFSAVRF